MSPRHLVLQPQEPEHSIHVEHAFYDQGGFQDVHAGGEVRHQGDYGPRALDLPVLLPLLKL